MAVKQEAAQDAEDDAMGAGAAVCVGCACELCVWEV